MSNLTARSKFLIFSGAVALAISSLVVIRLTSASSAGEEPSKPEHVRADTVRTLESQVERLETQLAVERRHARTAVEHAQMVAADAVEKAAAAAPALDVGEESAPPTPEEEAAWLAAREAFFDAHLRDEPRDEAWAGPLEDKIREMTVEGGRLTRVECRSSLCRLDLEYADAGARESHLVRLTETLSELPRASYSYPGEPHRHDRAVAFMARAEHTLPVFN